jgi:hypothetical protein
MLARLILIALVPSVAALAAGVAVPWNSLQTKLPVAPTSAPKLTFYRDTNGWCPFCERVWIALDKKGIAYDEACRPLHTCLHLRTQPYKAFEAT